MKGLQVDEDKIEKSGLMSAISVIVTIEGAMSGILAKVLNAALPKKQGAKKSATRTSFDRKSKRAKES